MKRRRPARRPSSHDPITRLAEAAKRVLAGELESARTLTDAVLEAHPARTDALELRAIVALEEADFDTAQDTIEQAIAIEPTAKRKVAWAKAKLGQAELEAAKGALRDALVLDPTDPTIYEVEAAVHAAGDDFEAALASAEGAVAIAPRRAESHACVARALLALDRGDGAVEAYVAAVRAPDGDARIRRNVLRELTELHEERGETEEAEATRGLLAQLGAHASHAG